MTMGRPLFLCDEMLGRLCRYLRAAGYDAALAQDGAADAALIIRAQHEGRWLLTHDRKMMEHRNAQDTVLLLPQEELDQLADHLARSFGLHWTEGAFSRCLVDNTPFVDATPEQVARIPPDACRPGEPARFCPACGRVYWQGSHYRRMKERLLRWQRKLDERHNPEP
jgi:hypothetical protein